MSSLLKNSMNILPCEKIFVNGGKKQLLGSLDKIQTEIIKLLNKFP